MADSVWIPRTRNYEAERKEGTASLEPTRVKDDRHPLFVTEKKPSSDEQKLETTPSKKEITTMKDPLSSGGGIDHPLHPLSEGYDPLSGSSNLGVTNVAKVQQQMTNVDDDLPTWENKKAGIISKYTTNESISVPSFVSGVGVKASVPVDRVKNRLEQLDQDDDDNGEMLQLTQKEYQRHIEKKRDELIKAWDKEKRVKALKTAIKCAKLLGETEKVVQFYPSKFVLITEILDTFGNLVFDRIKRRSTIYEDDTPIPLKENFRAEDVADHAQETCKNWFFKIASIRELLPRIYVEMAIVDSYRFIENETFPKIFHRLSKMIRGIADPLVAQYARCYLARKGRQVMRYQKDYLLIGFEDYMFQDKLFSSEKIQARITSRGIGKKEYLDLFSPALDWTLECLGHKADYRLLEDILKIYGDCENGFVLSAILSSFQPRLIAKHAIEFVNLIKKVSEETQDKLTLYRTLGVNLVLSSPRDEQKLKILNEIWKDVTKETRVGAYIEVAEVFIGYPLAHLSFKEADILLKDILDHVNVDKQYFTYQNHLQSIMQKILSNSNSNFHSIFSMKHFLPFLDLFRGDTQTEVNKALLQTFNRTPGMVSDNIVINTMFSVTKTVHDSINALSFDDEKREISQLLCTFIQKLDFGRDLEKHLNFYVEARRAFINLDVVKVELVKGACQLAIKTQQFVQGKLNKQTSAFVRACIAYCFITIPSIELIFERLYLFALAGEVAILNQSLPQADSLFKSAIQLVQEVPKHVEERDGKALPTQWDLLTFLKYFLSILVAVPGHPEHGPFYLINGFKKVVKEYEWEPKSTARITVYIAMIQCLCALYQKKLPYEWDKVESNEMLYGQTENYLESIRTFIGGLITDIREEFDRLSQFADGLSQSSQAIAALEFVNMAVVSVTITPQSTGLISEFFRRAKKANATMDKLQSVIDLSKSFATRGGEEATQMAYNKLSKALEEIKKN